ncbi:hypothetical protein, partial [Acinetobacter baumannii]|uniref:hypothetical protein n=1 Tax=Acinetobacter baumannii TaxID=470 RepID=UPI000AB02049
PKKPMEVEGQDYHFVTEEEFHVIDNAGGFLESVAQDGYYYGIKETDFAALFTESQGVIMVLNAEGTEK